MQINNRLLDDLARVASGALGVAAGVKGEVEALLRQRFERILTDMDLVGREEIPPAPDGGWNRPHPPHQAAARRPGSRLPDRTWPVPRGAPVAPIHRPRNVFVARRAQV